LNHDSIKLREEWFLARKPADQTVSPDEILIAAADLLRRKGYESTTMKDIAAEVNLTAASLYHHFKNKDALLLAVLETGLRRVILGLEHIVDSEQSAADNLRQMIALHIGGVTSNTAIGAAMVYEIRWLQTLDCDDGLTAHRDAVFALRDAFEQLFRRVVQEGIDSGEFIATDADILTKTMLGAHNWVGVWYHEGGRLDGVTIADMMAETFLRALVNN
jgi:AcrR family transcriptional regulator